MSLSSLTFPFLFFLLFTSSSSQNPNQISPTTFCNSTPYPNTCFNSLKLSLSINISPNILTFLLHTLETALSEAAKLTDLLSGANNLVEGQRGSLQDCKDLHHITSFVLKKSLDKIKDGSSRKVDDARGYLSAALTNKNTCLEGLESASGPLKMKLVSSFISSYKHVSNSLSALPKSRKGKSMKTSGETKQDRSSREQGEK